LHEENKQAKTKKSNKKKKKADDIKRNKSMKKIDELQSKVFAKEEEMSETRMVREELEEIIGDFEVKFNKLKQATNKEDPRDIVIKFELNSEINAEYLEIRDRKLTEFTKLDTILKARTEEFLELTSSKQDHTWRQVDLLQEQLQAVEAGLNSKMVQVTTIATTLEQLREWMTSIMTKYDSYLQEWDGVDDKIIQAQRDDINGLLEALQSRVTTFRQIIQSNANETQNIFTKKD